MMTQSQGHTVQKQNQPGCTVLLCVLVGFAVLLGSLILGGVIFETVMQVGDTERYPMPGQIYTVDGYAMHLHCLGKGEPTVVFIGGAGALSYQDRALQEQVSHVTRACVYDRAGYLWSDARPEARTAWKIMDELHTLLVTADVSPPYVLVGASNGGIYARAYAYEYPEEVKGLVLVDSRLETTLGQTQRLPVGILQMMGRAGLFRIFPGLICPTSACDPTYAEEIAIFRGYPSMLTTYEREITEGLDGSLEQIALLTNHLGIPRGLGQTPIYILAANQTGLPIEQADASYQAYTAHYRDYLSSLSAQTFYKLVNGGHGIAVEQPEIVLEAIETVLDNIP